MFHSEWSCSGFPQGTHEAPDTHRGRWLAQGHSRVGGIRGKNSGLWVALSTYPKPSYPGIESWPYVAPDTCDALALAPPLGARRGAWLGGGDLRPSRQAHVYSLAPEDLLDAYFDTCLQVICTIAFLKSVLNPWFIFLSLFFIIVFTQRQEHAFKLTF